MGRWATWSELVEVFTVFWFWIGVSVNLIIVSLIINKICVTIKRKIKNHKNNKVVDNCQYYSRSDWNESNPESDSYIGNKPKIPPTITSEPNYNWEDVLRSIDSN